MAIRLIHAKWYVDFRYRYRRYRKKSPLNKKGGAREYEIFLLKKLMGGESIDTPEPVEKEATPTFEEFAWQWFETFVKTNNKPSDQDSKSSILRNHLLPYFGSARLDNIDSVAVEKYKARQIAAGFASQSINNQLNVISGSLRAARDQGLIDRIPTVKRLPSPAGRIDYLTEEECSRLIEGETDPMWHSMVVTALRTGMRLGELRGLHWKEVDLQNQFVTVRQALVKYAWVSPKSGRIRHIPLAPDVLADLSARARECALVFHQSDGSNITESAARWHLASLCARARVRSVGWHTLRHTCASHLAMKDVSPVAIQRILGHSSVTTTERYMHLSPLVLRSAVNAVFRRQAGAYHHGPYLGNGVTPSAVVGHPQPATDR